MDFSQNTVASGLVSLTFIPPANDIYTIKGKINLPKPSMGGGESALVVTININASPVYTGSPAADGFKTSQKLLTSDTVTIVFSSAAAADQVKNAIKSSISISSGAV